MSWIAWPEGFVSIVEKPSDRGHDTLTVRARDKRSLAAFCTIATGHEVKAKNIKFKLATDYPYRRVLKREQVEAGMLEVARMITYSNFKTEAQRVRGKAYASVLGRVWSALLGLEDKATRDAVNRELKSSTSPLASLAGMDTSKIGTVVQPGDDDWDALLASSPDALTPQEHAELDQLDAIVAEFGVAGLTDAQWARYEELGNG